LAHPARGDAQDRRRLGGIDDVFDVLLLQLSYFGGGFISEVGNEPFTLQAFIEIFHAGRQLVSEQAAPRDHIADGVSDQVEFVIGERHRITPRAGRGDDHPQRWRASR
jgi:hypothetical protein